MSGGSRNHEASQEGQLTFALTLYLFCKSGLRQTVSSAVSSPVLGSSECWGRGRKGVKLRGQERIGNWQRSETTVPAPRGSD